MEADEIHQLLQECSAGKEKAWNRFYALYHSLIVGSVRQVCFDHDEDAIQQVYERLIQQNFRLLRRFGGNEEMFVVYLKRIARFVAYNHGKKLRRHRDRIVSQEELVEIADQTNGEGQLLRQEQRQEFWDYLAEIPLKYREVLLYISQGYKHREIADLMNIPINTSLTWAHRGKELLQQKMGISLASRQGLDSKN